MGYRGNIHLKPVEEWKKILEEADIYELQLPKSIKNLSAGKEMEWKTKTSNSLERNYWNRKENASVLEVVEVWTNPKNSVKVIVAGKDKKIAIFSREHGVEGWTSLKLPDRWSGGRSDVFDNLRRGTFIVTNQLQWRSTDWEINFISNEKKIEDVLAILENLYEINRLKRTYNEFRWGSEDLVQNYGTVTLNEVLHQKFIFLEKLRQFKWSKRKERWDLWNSVKANLSFKKDQTSLKVKAKSPYDGKTYYCECPVVEEGKEIGIGWRESSIYNLDFWLPFVYHELNSRFLTLPKQSQTLELTKRLLEVFFRLPSSNLILGVNQRRVKIERKRNSKGAKLNYLNGNLVARDDCLIKLNQYFLNGTPILPTRQSTKVGQKKTKVLSELAKGLIANGLNGVMRDLEGEFPFHLNVIFKEKENKWYLEIAGKEFYIKGGQSALKKIQSAIEGRAMLDHSKYGWNKHSTMMIRERIAELVGEENALWIILHVKRMGALMQTISGK